MNRALIRYNAVEMGINFERTANQNNADIVILPFFRQPGQTGGTLGFAEFPTNNGNPGRVIRLNTFYFNDLSIRTDAVSVIAHEIGHAIGFRHTDFMNRRFSCGRDGNEGSGSNGANHVPGTSTTPEENSWMLACTSNVDRPFTEGDGKDNLAVRRNSRIYMDIDFDRTPDIIFSYGNGNSEDEYLVGDWNGDGKDNIAVRRNSRIYMDTNFDGSHDLILSYGNGNSEDEYLVGDWDGDGKDNIAVRRNSRIYMDTNFDGLHDLILSYGNGNSEVEYLVGDWNGDGKDTIAVRRYTTLYKDVNFDRTHDLTQTFGFIYVPRRGPTHYIIGDWNGDGKDNVGVRADNKVYMDINFDNTIDKIQDFGFGDW